MEELKKAIQAAGEELRYNYEWGLDEDDPKARVPGDPSEEIRYPAPAPDGWHWETEPGWRSGGPDTGPKYLVPNVALSGPRRG